jgi:hypothetical protein
VNICGKLKVMDQMLEELLKTGHKILIFSQVSRASSHFLCTAVWNSCFKQGYFFDFSLSLFYTVSSAALRFHCVGGCWDRTQDALTTGLNLIHVLICSKKLCGKVCFAMNSTTFGFPDPDPLLFLA